VQLIINNLHIPIEVEQEQACQIAAAKRLQLAAEQFAIVRIVSKTLDLKDPEQFFHTISLLVRVDDNYRNRDNFTVFTASSTGKTAVPACNARPNSRPVIIGFGPAGMFAALEMIKCGLRPMIFERGKQIEERSVDVETFIRQRTLNPESNIQFGEGGAGSYSDGKLFSRRHNNTSTVNQVLRTFIRFRAPPEIEYISKPHLGTDVLCRIVRNIRLHILEHGGEILYNSRMTDLLLSDNGAAGVVINNKQEILSPHIFLALGHSARDTFAMLHDRGVTITRKKISVGVRIEHPAETINLMRYGSKYKDFPGLGAATYSLNYTNRKSGRGVYTFCMCPGGEVVNASSEQGQLVLNGMSYADRGLPFSNGALVVRCQTEDYPAATPLAGIAFQKDIEQRAFLAGGGNWSVPAQNLLAFLGKESSANLRKTSCKHGVVPADLRELFPDFVTAELLTAFQQWRDEVPLFVSSQAILLGPETRTSSPVRITRNEQYESINTENLYPIGEGAGYAGGITSSAADGIRAVETVFSEIADRGTTVCG
jgi:uncharacterized FAD-dependent dehydrogenase